MSYEEARRDRKRKRRNENLSLILGLVSGLGNSLMAQKQRGDDRAYSEQRDALKWDRERKAAEEDRAARAQESELNRQNQMNIADRYARARENSGRSDSKWEEEGYGAMSQYGDDPKSAMTAIDELLQKETDSFSPGYEKLMKDRQAIMPIYGRSIRTGTRAEAQPTGNMNPASTSAGPNVQAAQGQRQYGNLVQSLRGAYANNDPMAWEQIRQIYPQLGVPPMSIANPQMFGPGAMQQQ